VAIGLDVKIINYKGANMIYFDIETKANPIGVAFMPDPKPPSNYKKAESIEKYVAEKRAEQIERAALDADYGEIVAIAVKQNDYPIESMLVGELVVESDIINWFWKIFAIHHRACCGYNIIGFDLPYLLRRSFDLRIAVPAYPDLRKYQTYPTCDLMGILYNWGQAKSLKWVCQRYGIENPLPDLDGSQVGEMDYDTLKAYVENDAQLVYSLHQRMEGVYL
jgi:hypothetical protein